jgi:hypothetical protein
MLDEREKEPSSGSTRPFYVDLLLFAELLKMTVDRQSTMCNPTYAMCGAELSKLPLLSQLHHVEYSVLA